MTLNTDLPNNHSSEIPDSLRTFIINNTFTIAAVLEDEIILDINEFGADLLGYERSELIGSSITTLLTSRSKAAASEWLPKLKSEGPIYKCPIYECVRKDGTIVCIEANVVLWDPVTRTRVSIGHDVTERERGYRAISERYEFVTEHSADLEWQMGLNGIVLYVSSAIGRYGYTPDELIGHSFVEFLPQHEQPSFLARLSAYKECPTSRLFELQIRRKDGSLAWVEASVDVVVEDGVPIKAQGITRDIDQRKQAEAELRASEERYRSLVEQASDGIFLADSTGRYVDVNTRGCLMLGYTRDELLQMSIIDIINVDDVPELASHLDRMRNGETVIHEWYLIRKDGTVIPTEISAKQLSNGQLQGIVRDITRRKRVTEALRASEQRYRGLIESQQDLIVRVDPQGAFTFVNNAYCKMFGRPESELLGTSFVPLVHPDDIAATLAAIELLNVPPYRCAVEQRAMTVDGWRWISWEDCAIRDENGTTLEIQAIEHDITERKKTEEALRRSEARNRAILDALPDMLFLNSGDGTYLDYAAVSDRELYTPPDQFIGKRIADIFPPELAEPMMSVLQRTLESDEIQVLEYELPIDEEIRTYEARFVVCGEDEVLAIVRNVTERKGAEEAIRKAHEELAKSYDLQRDFLNNITHEVRTPLTAVQGYVEMLIEGLAGPLSKEQCAMLEKVLLCSGQLLQIVSGVLEIARLKSGRIQLCPRVCNPMNVVDKATSVVLPQANQKGLVVNVHMSMQQNMGMYDEEKLTAIVTNLLANAVKFTESGEVTVMADSNNKGTEIIIADTGIGIGQDDLRSIFEEFSQLDYPRKHKPSGFGLGLAIVATMVETIGATLTVSSKKGVGTAFSLWAPVIEVHNCEENSDEFRADSRP